MSTATVSASQRYTKERPCPICGGYPTLPAGHGVRCFGFVSDDGIYCRCTRPEYAGDLDIESETEAYVHHLTGPCRCGQKHGEIGPNPTRHGQAAPHLNSRGPTADLGPIVSEYLYPGPEGAVRHRVTRHAPKTFRPWHWNGNGRWEMGEGDKKLPLYRLPDILAADPAAWVVVVEGEKDADRLAALGFLATTNAGGAGKWHPELSEHLRGRRICVVRDNDEPGKRHADAVARSLTGIASDVRVLTLPNLPPKGDASDWLDAGGSAEALTRLINSAPPPEAQSASASAPLRVRFMTAREFASSTPAQTPWVAPPFVPVGGITKIDGSPKVAGKTTFITHMIAAVVDGADFLGQATMKGPVVALSEQGSTSFRESLQRADLLHRDNLHLAIYRDFASLSWPDVVAQAFDYAREVGAVMLVVDTLPACAGVRGDDENSSGRALEVMAPVQLGADTHGIGVVIAFHDKKGGGEVGESGRGSSAYAGAVDVVLRLTKPGGNFSPTIRKIEALSRFDATPPELYIELTPGGYVSLGSEDDVVTAALARALVTILPDTEEAAKRIDNTVEKDKDTDEEHITERGLIDELSAQGVKVSRSTLDSELKRWVKDGYVGQTGLGKKGSPHRFWLIAKPPDAFFRSKTDHPSEESISHERQATTAETEESQQPTEMDSSDAHTPSEERNLTDSVGTAAERIHSSDDPAVYIGSNEFFAPGPNSGEEGDL